jgi:hypothetical protein
MGASASEYSCAHGSQINVEDPTPYLTYENIELKENYKIWIKKNGIVRHKK